MVEPERLKSIKPMVKTRITKSHKKTIHIHSGLYESV